MVHNKVSKQGNYAIDYHQKKNVYKNDENRFSGQLKKKIPNNL